MKVLTPEQEEAHYIASVKGGTIGGLIGTAVGAAAVIGASRRYPSFRALTLPFRAFLVTSAGTFVAVIAADRASAAYDIENTPEKKAQIQRDREREALLESNKTAFERAKEWANENRYPLLFGFWVASMAGSWTMVNRNPYLSGSQKLVQARMYAQGGTLAALLASFAIEGNDVAKGKGRWETIKVLDPNDPTHQHIIEKKIHHERYAGEDQWREMVEAEEERMKERNAHIEAKREHPDNKKKQDQAQKEKEEKDRSGAKS
ncbi:Replication factor C, subunit RFC4 [Ascochyta rabiei]|uniref:Integral component of membrane n=1 Tax=Didymella rabiei TaxID=5454 RepID=A0A163H935_DIDRA|nr:Replication factor C, subunit RFC4 [Ascochyta rabiei]KZM25204.1 integral component of membrane [Ascochyta rabiei]UPX18186.1 Replication factor C, subunit RFC4 [Ascochyta rabiei]